MTHQEFRAALGVMELSQVSFSHVLGVDPRTVRRWALGELRIPRSVEVVLWFMLRYPDDVASIPPPSKVEAEEFNDRFCQPELSRGVAIPKPQKAKPQSRRSK